MDSELANKLSRKILDLDYLVFTGNNIFINHRNIIRNIINSLSYKPHIRDIAVSSQEYLSEYVVGVVDILGAKEMILEKENETLNLVSQIYKNAIRRIKLFTESFCLAKGVTETPIDINIFSDNIIVSSIVNCDSDCDLLRTSRRTDSFYMVVLIIHFFQFHLALYGILARGGITINDFYFDKIASWGQGLLDANELEKKAKYPRIIIDKKLKKLTFDNYVWNKFLSVDSDDEFFVDYIQSWFLKGDFLETNGYLAYDALDKITQPLLDKNILYKWQWQANYIENKVQEFVKRSSTNAKNQ